MYPEDNLCNQGLQFIRARNKIKKKKNNFLNNKSISGGGDFVVKFIILIIIVKDLKWGLNSQLLITVLYDID